tara:strand:+ start:12210 stop:13988 length:1779 start_codon:yes stop_codon:yes gene_type:complete
MARKPFWTANLTATVSALLAATAFTWISFVHMPPIGLNGDLTFTTDVPWLLKLWQHGWHQATTGVTAWQFVQDPTRWFRVLLQTIDRFDLRGELIWRLCAILVGALLTTSAVWFYTWSGLTPVDRLKHIRGRQLITGRKAARQARRAQNRLIRQHGRGINIAPGIPLSLETETKHFLLVGASGGGKTQTLRYWIDQAVKSNDKLLLHDTKGDMTSGFPSDDFVLLAPHDARTWAWDVARDCKGLASARELASRLIPASGDNPMWANGAREILTGLIRFLQIHEGNQWDWRSLRDIAFSSPTDILESLNDVHQEGAKYIEIDPETGIPHKTSFSFLVTLWSGIGGVVSPLAAAWSDIPDDRKVSLTAWLRDGDARPRSIILQRSSEFADLSEAWIGAAVQLLANDAASTSFGDSCDRRVWMFLDEFAQLGKLKGFQQFLEVGRSRGIRCAFGLQDLEQLSDLYGQEALKTWLNTIETKIICRMNAGPSATFIADDLIGKREVSWKEKNTTTTSNNIFEDRSGTRSTNTQIRTDTVPVIFPDYLERELGPIHVGGEHKIRALYLASGNLLQLDWPITSWAHRRDGSQPAAWTLG